MKSRTLNTLVIAVLAAAFTPSCSLLQTAQRSLVPASTGLASGAPTGGNPASAQPVSRPLTEYDVLRLRIMERMAGATIFEEGGAR